MKTNKSGQSLVEVLIVVTVFLLLGTIVMSSLPKPQKENNMKGMTAVETEEIFTKMEKKINEDPFFKQCIYYFPFIEGKSEKTLASFLSANTNLEVASSVDNVVIFREKK